ncbi:hypothetical protein Tco_0146182 [Tanacetum coccineum]
MKLKPAPKKPTTSVANNEKKATISSEDISQDNCGPEILIDDVNKKFGCRILIIVSAGGLVAVEGGKEVIVIRKTQHLKWCTSGVIEGMVTSWREEDLIRETDLYMPMYQCRLPIYSVSRTKEGVLAAQHGSSGWFQSAQKGAFVAWQQPASTRPLGPHHSSPCSSNSGIMPTVARLRKQRKQWQRPTVHASMHGDVAQMFNRSGLINEDKGRQDALLELAFRFEDSCTVREDLIKAYEKCYDMSQESRALICTFLKESSGNDHKLHLSMYGKASRLEKQIANCSLTEKELHQLRMDEEALREMLEEEAMNKKAQEEKIRQKQAGDDKFFLEFRVVRYDS